MRSEIASLACSAWIGPRELVSLLVDSSRRFLSSPHQQVSANKGLQISVHHAVHVTHLFLRTVIFDHAIGLQHIGTYLRSEIDVELGVFNLPAGLTLFLQLQFVELRTQHAHGAFPVLVLRALVLTTHHGPSWD